MTDRRLAIEKQLTSAVSASLIRLAGSGFRSSSSSTSLTTDHDTSSSSQQQQWKEQLERIANASISFPNNNESDVDGKPHDVECRAALTLFHITGNSLGKKNAHCNTVDKDGKKKKRKKKKNQILSDGNNSMDSFELISELGTQRQICSAITLANLLSLELEKELQSDSSSKYNIQFFDIRSNESGIIHMVSKQRSQELHEAGKLPCSHCVRWFKGQKGLWWHQLKAHNITYASATESAADAVNCLAVIVFQEQQEQEQEQQSLLVTELEIDDDVAVLKPSLVEDNEMSAAAEGVESVELDPFELVKAGNIDAFVTTVESKSFSPANQIDRNGATALHWAAGAGNLPIVIYLVETCKCNPNQPQKAKRAFRGRTPLHWAARNGHLEVVKYLVNNCAEVDINATTQDGTTAFCWASWQGHLDVMRFLRDAGCDIHAENSFGCNAVLWTAQGDATVETLSWLQQAGMDFYTVNSNGHTALHKAAQRGSITACKWIVDTFMQGDPRGLIFIGPDTEGHCPSDLCSMDGHKELAEWMQTIECSFIRWYARTKNSVPTWLQEEMNIPLLASTGRSHCAVRCMVESINEVNNCTQKKARIEELAINLYDID